MGYYVVLPQRKRRGEMIDRFVEWLREEQVGGQWLRIDS
jgi:hypothetical protein